MNYLKEIIAFHRMAEIEGLSSSERVLWFALMDICNSLGWTEYFTVANLTLQSKTGLSEKGIINTRNKLSQRGYIEFRSRGGKAPEYILVSQSDRISETDTTQHFTADSGADTGATVQPTSVPTCSETAADSSILNKPNKTKQNKTGISARRFAPPTVDEVKIYCQERKNKVDPSRFVDFYASKGWMVGKSPMRDWRAAVRNWEKPDNMGGGKTVSAQQYKQREYSDSDYPSDIDWLELAMKENKEAAG